MKRIVHSANARDKLLHVEAEGCVVNIRVGLTDSEGRPVTSIEILPDQYVGEEWDLDGTINNRVIRRAWEHPARPDDDPEPGDRCKDCGKEITWVGPSQVDWLHVDTQR